MRLFRCPSYEQSSEKGGSHELRDSCKKCGKTFASHQPLLPPRERAKSWLKSRGYDKSSFFHLVENLLADYIQDTEGD